MYGKTIKTNDKIILKTSYNPNSDYKIYPAADTLSYYLVNVSQNVNFF